MRTMYGSIGNAANVVACGLAALMSACSSAPGTTTEGSGPVQGSAPGGSSESRAGSPGARAAAAPSSEGSGATSSGFSKPPLYARTVATDHVVELYDFGDGAIAVRESYSKDSGQTSYLDTIRPITSMAQVYTSLNPGAPIPDAITKADQAAVLRQQTYVAPPPSVAHPSAGQATPPVASQVLQGADSNCSADFYGDNWSAQWFINGFCDTTQDGWCRTNWLNSDTGTVSHGWVSWLQFEGDFNVAGHMEGTHWSCEGWLFGSCIAGWINLIDIDINVNPRRVEEVAWSPAPWVEAWGSSPCNHMGSAFRHN